MTEWNDKGIYEMYEDNRKMFDSIRRQILKLQQKEKDKYYKPTLSKEEVIITIFERQ